MLNDFVAKTNFFTAVKENNKLNSRRRDPESETYQQFIKNSLGFGDLPLPVLLRIKKGILYIPQGYKVTEGLSVAIKNSLERLESIGRFTLTSAIFDHSSMSDLSFSNVLKGLSKRREFSSLTSVNNEIGLEASQEISAMLRPSSRDSSLPNLKEMSIVGGHCEPVAFDRIMDSMRISSSLKSLTLQSLNLSERQF